MPTKTFPMAVLILLAAAGLLGAGCAQGDDPGAAPENEGRTGGSSASSADQASPAERASTRMDTIYLEGMPEPMSLRLFRTPDGFPLQFSAYVPEDMEAEVVEDEQAAVQFVAAFGGQRSPQAFVHVYVYPEGTDAQAALGTMRSFGASRGIPVSMGIDPLPEPETRERMPWADRGFSFRYQGEGGWIVGSMGLGSHDGRFFHVVTHYPAEYGDGFGPRVAMILETWRWEDGSDLDPNG